jgi:aspartate/methionine/tyrosine aminotransferase
MPTQPLSFRTQGVKLSSIRQVAAKMQSAAEQGIKITNFAAGRLDLDSPSRAKKATQKAMEQGWVHYASTMGRSDLRLTLARRLGKDFRLNVDPEQIIITLGATEAMYVALQSLLNPGDEVLVPQPMYVYYEGWAALGGAKTVPVPLDPMDDFLLRAGQVRSRLSSRTKALIINSPHNPTGQVFNEQDLSEIAQMAQEEDFYLICDDVYSYLLYDGVRHFPIATIPGLESRTIMVGSLSKTYAMDGWRVGYLAGPPDFMEHAVKIHQYAVGSANTFVQFGAREVLEDPQDFVQDLQSRLARRRELMLSGLDQMGLPYVRPRGGFYVFPAISRFGYGSERFSEFLFAKAQVAVVPGIAFGPGGEGHVRMAYCTSRPEIEQGLERIAKALSLL